MSMAGFRIPIYVSRPVDPSETGVKQAHRQGLHAAHGMVEDGWYESNFFDVIRLSNVVEHLPKPKEAFGEIRRISNLKVSFT